MKSSIKKVVAGLSVVAMLASAMQVVSAWYFEDEIVSDFKTREYNAGMVIEEYTGSTKDKIVIPDTLPNADGEERPVVGILDYAFAKVADDTTIYIPKSVKDIREEAFITAGSLDKMLVEGVKGGDADKAVNANDIATYWGGKVLAAVSSENPEKVIAKKIADKVNAKISGIDKIKNIGTTIGTELNKIMDGIEVPSEEDLAIAVPDFSTLSNVEVTVDDKDIQYFMVGGKVGAYVNWDDVKGTIKDNVENQIRTEVNKKLNDPETGLNAMIEAQKNKIPDVEAMKDDISAQVYGTVDTMLADFKPMLDMLDDIEGTINGYVNTYKESAMNVLADIPVKGSASQTAVAVLESIRGYGDEAYRVKIAENYKKVAPKLGLNANVDVVSKLKNASDKVIDDYPYFGVSLVGEPVNTEEGEVSAAKEFAQSKKIAFEFGEPDEPKKEVHTSIVTEEPKIEYVDGGTKLVTGTSKIVYVDNPIETVVTSIVTVPVEVEVTKIVTETVIVEKPIYITESTTAAPTYIKGDVDQNGKLALRDVIWIAENIIEKREFSDLQVEIGDMNNNGKIDLRDAIMVATLLVQQM